MSGAEASLVLGLISSVIAIVDASKKIYDAAADSKGLPEAFREVAGRLPIVRTILGSVEQHITDGKVDEETCKSIKPVVTACKEKAEKLDMLFQKVIPPDGASRLERYIKAAKTLGKGGRVESWMKGILEDVQLLASNHTMTAATASQIEDIDKAIEEVSNIEPSIPDSVLQETAFTNNNYGNGPMTNNNVQGDQFTATNTATGEIYQAKQQTISIKNEHAGNQTFRADIQNFGLRFILAILGQLEFSGMADRYEDIAAAYRQTFRWIYEKPELKFVDWLEAGTGVYWITGKAGSGKSTLMKYLYEDPRTMARLPKDIQDTLVAGFFFHDRGHDPLLKSQEGLFRAIMHEILSRFRQLIPVALPKRFASIKADIRSNTAYSRISDWPLRELKAGFKAIVSQNLMPLHLCLLIDGLDEFSGDHQTIVDALSDLLPRSKDSVVRVQLCISSRQLIKFEKAYQDYPHLKVQDLTKEDIKSYVSSNFKSIPELRDLMLTDPETSSKIMEEILKKAEGVFLWVSLVVKSLVESLENSDDLKIVHRRLSALPAGLEQLYARMLGVIQPFYHVQAARTIRIVQLAKKPLSPLAMYFIDDDASAALSEEQLLSESEIEIRHAIVAKRLKARTAGLIEISSASEDDRSGSSSQPSSTDTKGAVLTQGSVTSLEPGKVQYLHLTVKEFFLSNNVPSWLSNPTKKYIGECHELIAASCLRQLKTTQSHSLYGYGGEKRSPGIGGGQYWTSISGGLLFMILQHSLQAERTSLASQLRLLEKLDHTIMPAEPQSLNRRRSYDMCVKLDESIKWHWTYSRYGDWSEPDGWHSDYVSFLVSIGMTRSVIAKLCNGYNPALKSGRPLLLYATCSVAPDYAITDLERDTIDPLLVEELLKRSCSPNQIFNSRSAYDIRDEGTRTTWEAVLVQIEQRFGGDWSRTADAQRYEDNLLSRVEAMRDLKLRWLKTIKLFLDYGADPCQFVTNYYIDGPRTPRGQYRKCRVSALAIINRVYKDFEDPLLTSIRGFMTSKGAIEQNGDLDKPSLPSELWQDGSHSESCQLSSASESRLRHIPFIGKTLAARKLEKLARMGSAT